MAAAIRAHPDIVRLPAHWFHVLARDPGSGRLLATMVETLRRRGTKVQAEGIDSASHLRMAMEAKADLLQGALLGDPAAAGMAFDAEPRPVANLLGCSGNVVLFGSIVPEPGLRKQKRRDKSRLSRLFRLIRASTTQSLQLSAAPAFHQVVPGRALRRGRQYIRDLPRAVRIKPRRACEISLPSTGCQRPTYRCGGPVRFRS